MSSKDKKSLVLSNAHTGIQKLLQKNADALPRDFNKTRFLQNCMTVLQDTKGIESCQPISIARTMIKGAFLGLDFFNKECYAIPYGGNLQFQTDYKGEIKLSKKYSINPIKDIYAKLVKEGDEFTEGVENGQQTINFKPKPFNNGEILGAFAVALFKDGSMIYEAMSKEEIEKVRQDYSKAKNSTAWTKSTGEMYKKTVLRRLCKLIELDFDTIEQKKAFDEGSGMEFDNESKEVVQSPFNDAIEAEYEDITGNEDENNEQLELEGTPFGEGDGQ